jgi:hypothetical protein
MHARILVAWLAALLVLPAGAAAANTPELTYPTGTRLATESAVRGANVGEVLFTGSSGTVFCTSATPKGKVTKNNGTEVEVSLNGFSLTGTGGDGRCTGGSTQTYVSFQSSCLRSTPELTEDEFQIRGAGCSEGTAPLTVTFSAPSPNTCVYESTSSVTGTFTTHPSDAVLTSSPSFARVSGSLLCYASLKIDSSFTFEKNEAGTNPVYISGGPTLTYPTGTKLAGEPKLRGLAVGSITLTDLNGNTLLSCTAGETTGTLRKNSGTEIEMSIESGAYTGTGTDGACTTSFGDTKWTINASSKAPWCLRATSAMAADEFKLGSGGCPSGTGAIKLTAEPTAPLVMCTYERKAAIAGTFTTHPEDATLKFGDSVLLEKEPRSPSCPDETQMDASFTLERDEAGSHPMYIS